jgi:hypothetical protein
MEEAIARRIRGHKANLDRYARLLATNLTELEREYVHRRIAEEHRAIEHLGAGRLAAPRDQAPGSCHQETQSGRAPRGGRRAAFA